ncbi:MAG: hypothetical protein KatS3mg081_1049 [Gemmatimonadales bacterium]|nr:MAG: hypothetical protein KatS3mg081_1049 [Gemmatimonadales bacterium]
MTCRGCERRPRAVTELWILRLGSEENAADLLRPQYAGLRSLIQPRYLEKERAAEARRAEWLCLVGPIDQLR